MTERIVKANGIDIWCEDFGDPADPALLLVMGAGGQGLHWPDDFCAALAAGNWLAPDARVYLERAAAGGEPSLPAGWRLLRSKRAGEVGYHLAATTDHPEASRPGAPTTHG